MRHSNSWTYMDKQVTELSGSQQQSRTHNFFDLDDDLERDNPSDSVSFDSLRPRHNLVSSRLSGENIGMSNGFDLVSEIDRKIKEHVDNVLYAVEGLSARVTQLETRTLKVENTVDDLKELVEYNHGRNDGKLRELENILREVEGGVKDLRDKQQIAEAQLQLAKLQLSKGIPQLGKQKSASETDSTQKDISIVAQPSNQLPNSCPQQPVVLPISVSQDLQHQSSLQAPVAPVATAPQLPTQLPQNFASSISPQWTPETSHQQYLMPSSQQSQFSPSVSQPPQHPVPHDITNQQYHRPAVQQSQPPPSALPQSYRPASLETTNQQYQVPPTQQVQPLPSPAPYPPYQPTPQPPTLQLSQPPQLHPPSRTVRAQVHSSLNRQHEEVPYLSSQGIQKSSAPSGGFFPSQQFYDGSKQQFHDQRSNRPYSEFSSGYPQPQDDSYSNMYHYGASPFSTGTFNAKPSRPSPSSSVARTGNSTTQLPTAKILPQALPTASVVESGSTTSGNSNRVPVDDVIDKVVAMGFRRDLVRATVRKLTENGQSVDLNVVLDKLMNG